MGQNGLRKGDQFMHSFIHSWFIHSSFYFVQRLFLKCPVCVTLRDVRGEGNPADVLRGEGRGHPHHLLGQISITLL